MDLGPSGRNAIVRASSRGLGRACARSPAREGAGSQAPPERELLSDSRTLERAGRDSNPDLQPQLLRIMIRTLLLNQKHPSDNRLIILTSVITTA
jgi:NAD(P)-dependent dehydrogenase (short-subunit alcohol dehydrogenase family)